MVAARKKNGKMAAKNTPAATGSGGYFGDYFSGGFSSGHPVLIIGVDSLECRGFYPSYQSPLDFYNLNHEKKSVDINIFQFFFMLHNFIKIVNYNLLLSGGHNRKLKGYHIHVLHNLLLSGGHNLLL